MPELEALNKSIDDMYEELRDAMDRYKVEREGMPHEARMERTRQLCDEMDAIIAGVTPDTNKAQ